MPRSAPSAMARRCSRGAVLWLWWLVANAAAWSAGLVLLSELQALCWIPGLVPVGGVGLAQWLVLRRSVARLDWWLPATSGGGLLALPWIVLPISNGTTGDPFQRGLIICGGIFGAVLGGPQGLVLRRLPGRAAAWVLASIVAGLLLWPVYRAVLSGVDRLTGPAPLRTIEGHGEITSLAVATWLLQGAACGAIYAAITGPVLVGLAFARRPAATGTRANARSDSPPAAY